MGMTRGTALVSTVARVTQLTGVQHLDNLETGGDLTLTDLLVTASDAIYDRLEVDGLDPTALTNETRFELAIAYEFLTLLVSHGALRVDGESPGETTDRFVMMADRFYTQRRPQSTDDTGRNPSEPAPRLANFTRGMVYDNNVNPYSDSYTKRRPRRNDS